MLSKDELLKYPDYLLTKYQLEIYRQVVKYMQEKNISKGKLAKEMNVSNPYISQILNGNFNYTLKKLIEIGLTIGQVPQLSFIPIEQYKADFIAPNGQVSTFTVPVNNSKQPLSFNQTTYSNTVVGSKPTMYIVKDEKLVA